MLICPVHNSPADNRGYNFSHKLPAVKRRIPRLGAGLRGFKRPSLFGIEDRDIGLITACEASAAFDIDHSRRARGEKLDDPCQRNPGLAMQPGDSDAESGLQAGHSTKRTLALDDLFIVSI